MAEEGYTVMSLAGAGTRGNAKGEDGGEEGGGGLREGEEGGLGWGSGVELGLRICRGWGKAGEGEAADVDCVFS